MRLGIQINRDGNRSYVQINSNDYEKIENALEEQTDISVGEFGFNPRNEYRVKELLEKLFDNHSHFYSYIGFDGGTEHGPTGQSFDTSGFRQFLNDAFNHDSYLYMLEDEEALQRLCDIIAERIRDILNEYEDELVDDEEDFVAKSTVSIEAEPSGTLNDPEIMDEGVFIGSEGAYKIRVSEVEDAETIEDVKNQVMDRTRETYENQVNVRTDTLKNRIENLEEKMEEQKRNMLVKGVNMVNELDDWKVEDGYLVYQNKIHLQRARHKSNEDELPKELTEEAKEKFYIDGLKVQIRDQIRSPKYEDAHHPHALGHGMCSGSFREPLSKEGLQDMVEQMRQADLHSGSHTDAEQELKENFDEYTVNPEEEEETEETEQASIDGEGGELWQA